MFRLKPPFSLDNSLKGQHLKIHSLPEGAIRAQFIRVGISIGSKVKCLERLFGGTIVLQKRRQEIAVGNTLARRIMVIPVENDE